MVPITFDIKSNKNRNIKSITTPNNSTQISVPKTFGKHPPNTETNRPPLSFLDIHKPHKSFEILI